MRPFVALDTATDHIAVAIGDLDRPGEVVATEDFPAPRAANTIMLLAIERLLQSAGLESADIEAVVCGRGPGSFTGVRIGVTTAKGLAHGRVVPLVGVGTLDAIAHRLRETADGLVGALGDAMRGEVYPALFRVRDGVVERLGSDRVSAPLPVAEEWASLGQPVSLTGNGLAKHGSLFAEVMGSRAREVPARLWTPDGGSLLAAAWAIDGPGSLRTIATMARDEAYAAAHPAVLLPVYTRLSDAEEAERLRVAGTAADGVGVPAAGVAGPEGSA